MLPKKPRYNFSPAGPNGTKLGKYSCASTATKLTYAFYNSISEAVATLFNILQFMQQQLPFTAPPHQSNSVSKIVFNAFRK